MSVTRPTLKPDPDDEDDDEVDEPDDAPPPLLLELLLLLLPHAASAATQHSIPMTAAVRRPKPVKSSPIVQWWGQTNTARGRAELARCPTPSATSSPRGRP